MDTDTDVLNRAMAAGPPWSTRITTLVRLVENKQISLDEFTFYLKMVLLAFSLPVLRTK